MFANAGDVRKVDTLLGRSIQGYLEEGSQTPVAQGRSTHFDDRVDSDQQAVNKDISLPHTFETSFKTTGHLWKLKPRQSTHVKTSHIQQLPLEVIVDFNAITGWCSTLNPNPEP